MMASAGLTHVEFGTESLSDQVLASYHKPFRMDHIFESHRAANEAELYVAHYFLLGGPGETSATLDETLSNVARLDHAVGEDRARMDESNQVQDVRRIVAVKEDNFTTIGNEGLERVGANLFHGNNRHLLFLSGLFSHFPFLDSDIFLLDSSECVLPVQFGGILVLRPSA